MLQKLFLEAVKSHASAANTVFKVAVVIFPFLALLAGVQGMLGWIKVAAPIRDFSAAARIRLQAWR